MEEFGEFKVTETEFWYWFNILNEEVFGGVVPKPDVMEIGDLEDNKNWAYVLHSKFHNTMIVGLYVRKIYPHKAFFINVLAHEMVHIWQLKVNGDTGSHNKHFFSWKNKFKQFGLDLKKSC